MIDSFESSGWTHKCKVFPTEGMPYEQEFGNIFTPEGYTFWFRHGMPVVHDQYNYDGWSQPEARYSSGYPERVFDGNQSFMFFGFYRVIDAGLMRQYPCQVGSTLNASIMAHAWSSTNDNPATSDGITQPQWFPVGEPGLTDAQRNAAFWIGIDPTGQDDPYAETVVWGEGKHIYNEFEKISVQTKATGTTFTVFIRAKFLWRFKHNDAYLDYLEVTETPDTGGDCWGLPREDYKRTIVLMPGDATQEDWIEAVVKYHSSRYTISGSADDAGIGALTDKNVIAVWVTRESWKEGGLETFYQKYYDAPQSTVKLTHDRWYGPVIPPLPTPKHSKNLIGLHSTFLKPGWDKYLVGAQANVVKNFSFGDAAQAKKLRPEVLSVFRKHIGDDGSWVTQKDPVKAGYELCDIYEKEIVAYAKNEGITVEEALKLVDVLESLNETVPTYNPEHTKRAVAVDVAFSRELHRRWGDNIYAGLLTVAVGNPHESEVVLLLPAAKQAAENGDYITYHGYWSANKQQNWLSANWKYHAGRWTEWDKVFVENGYKVRYYLGESGICYAEDGWGFVPTRGWKSCGDFPSYLKQIDTMNTMMRDWNASHGNRCYGATLFGFGMWGWTDFEIGTGDVELMIAWSKTLE